MKTSFADFIEVAYESSSVRNPIYIDCDQVQAVRPHLDYNCNPMETQTDLILGPQLRLVVEGKADKVLEKVKAFSKGSKS